MPEGQFSGDRIPTVYTDDAGESYILTMDRTLASLSGAGNVEATIANSDGVPQRPIKFKPRGVYWQCNDPLIGLGKRKFIICGSAVGTLYASDSSQQVTIDGATGFTTGRRGEALSFVRKVAGTAAAD